MAIQINKGAPYWSRLDYAKVEEIKDAIWVADLPAKTRDGGWSEEPVAVFWQPNPPDGHGNYFGLYVQTDMFNRDKVVICNAQSAVEGIISGVMSEDGEVIFSRYRHDFRTTKDGTASTDGGRDYHKFTGKPVRLRVEGPDLVLVDDMGE